MKQVMLQIWAGGLSLKAVCCRSKEVKKKKKNGESEEAGGCVGCSEIVEIKISEVKKSGSDSWIVDGDVINEEDISTVGR